MKRCKKIKWLDEIKADKIYNADNCIQKYFAEVFYLYAVAYKYTTNFIGIRSNWYTNWYFFFLLCRHYSTPLINYANEFLIGWLI